MSYENSLMLRNIIPMNKGREIINFNESKKLIIYRDINSRGISFYNNSLSKFIENELKTKGLWDEEAHSLMNNFILFNYWDILPQSTTDVLERKVYTKTRTYREYTGREIVLLLDNWREEDNTKYLLLTRFVYRTRIIEPPTTNELKITTTQHWKPTKPKLKLETSFISSNL